MLETATQNVTSIMHIWAYNRTLKISVPDLCYMHVYNYHNDIDV